MKRCAHVYPDPQPLSDMNTTPLIDVMLVLLIMMILNIPLQTHKTGLILPQQSKVSPGPPPYHVLTLEFAGTTLWDGAPVAPAALDQKLRVLGAAAAPVQLRIRPDGYVKYDRVLKVMAQAQRHKVVNMAFVGIEAFAVP